MTDFENKPAAGVPGPREGASARPGGGSRETVLLGDVPDVAQPPAETVVSSPNNSGLATNVLAALGQRYEILGEAGHGSMGNVYKARDRETGETVALKLLKPEIASDQAMMDRFKNELLFARKITHKNVCRVYEFNRLGGIAYTSMEFVEGESLRSGLNRFGALTRKKATDLALQICSGLKEAHAQGIVHRDLKPENVMIDTNGNLEIMDFGIARPMQAASRQTGTIVHTPAYMAPEQVSGSPVDYRTAIYSLGLMLYEMFTGKPAFSAENAIAVALKQMREDPAPPRTIDPSIPVPLERIMLKCLAKEPAKRFQTVAALESALQTPSAAATLPPPIVAPAVAAAHALRPTPVAAAPLSAPPRKSTAGPTVCLDFIWFSARARDARGPALARGHQSCAKNPATGFCSGARTARICLRNSGRAAQRAGGTCREKLGARKFGAKTRGNRATSAARDAHQTGAARSFSAYGGPTRETHAP